MDTSVACSSDSRKHTFDAWMWYWVQTGFLVCLSCEQLILCQLRLNIHASALSWKETNNYIYFRIFFHTGLLAEQFFTITHAQYTCRKIKEKLIEFLRLLLWAIEHGTALAIGCVDWRDGGKVLSRWESSSQWIVANKREWERRNYPRNVATTLYIMFASS